MVKNIKSDDGIVHQLSQGLDGDATAFEALMGTFKVQLEAKCANIEVAQIVEEGVTCLECLAYAESPQY
jgi:hypothetical protein